MYQVYHNGPKTRSGDESWLVNGLRGLPFYNPPEALAYAMAINRAISPDLRCDYHVTVERD